MSTTVNIDRISTAALQRALSVVVTKNARDFKVSTRRKMIESNPSGRIYEKGRGRGFTRSHRASSRGQRPAVDTGTLAQAVQSQNTSDISAVVDIAHTRNPENGEFADDYAERLQDDLDRPIINSDDVRVAQIKFDFEIQQTVDRLIK